MYQQMRQSKEMPAINDNLREKRVQSARDGFKSRLGTRVATTRDSFVWAERDLMGWYFCEGPGEQFKSMKPADREKDPDYRAAYQEWLYETVLLDRCDKIAAQRIGYMMGWVEDNPPNGTPDEAWVQRLAIAAIQAVITYDNPELFARTHQAWWVEDEATAQILVEQVCDSLGFDATVNFNAQTQTVAVTSLSAKPSKLEPEAFTPGPDPTAADLPVVTRTMSAISGHMHTAELHEKGKGESDTLHIGSDSVFVGRLPRDGRAFWESFGLQDAGPLTDFGAIQLYIDLLDAWYEYEDEMANCGDPALALEALEGALDAFEAR